MVRMVRRRPAALLSREPKREPYDVVLIVCEGSKTEPSYLKGLQKVHRLSSANIEIAPSPKQDPVSIVAYARKRMKEEEYDQVFCVFDRDGHARYNEAVERLKRLNAAGLKISGVTSWPCFELWLLLHFVYTTRAFKRFKNVSACDRVIRELKQHLPNYDKGLKGLYEELLPKRDAALANARRLERDNRKTGTVNPSTHMHNLVSYLLKLKGS